MREVPRIIAFCGNPTSGKSIAAEIVSEIYGHSHLDDGLPLRKIAMAYLGLTEHQVFTQEGKLERVMLNGREWTVRQILGELGNVFEEKFGADIIPLMSLNTRAPDERLVCSAVRREQGRFWREQGALVLEAQFVEAQRHRDLRVDHDETHDCADEIVEFLFALATCRKNGAG